MASARYGSLGPGSVVAAALALGVAAGCATPAPFIWIDQVPKGMLAAEDPSVLGRGDVIGIRVWNQDAISMDRTRVREDGKISLPFLNDVEVAGVEPVALARRLEVGLKPFIVNPVVTVIVHERRPLRISVVGRVTRQGAFDLEPGAGVVHAIAAAGGLTPFAHEDRVFVIRNNYSPDGEPSGPAGSSPKRPKPLARIRFRYDELCRGTAPATSFRLHHGDVVVVE